MKKRLIQILKYLFFISLGLILLFIAFRGIDFSKVWAGLLRADYSWIILSLFFSVLAFISRARRWILLISPLGYKPSLKNSFNAVMAGYLANIAFPRLGEVTKCIALGKKEKIEVEKLVGTIIIERTIDMLSLLVITVLMLLTGSDPIIAFIKNEIFLPAGNKLSPVTGTPLLSWLILILSIVIVTALIYRYRGRLKSVKLISGIFHFSKGIAEGMRAVLKLERRKEFIFHTVFIWVNYILMTWVVVFAIESTSGLAFPDAMFLLVVGSLAMVVPVQSGIGVFHLLISRALNAVYGISVEDGLVYATISHETQLILIALLGSVSFIILFLGRKKENSL